MKKWFREFFCKWLLRGHYLAMRWDENPGLRCMKCGWRPPLVKRGEE